MSETPLWKRVARLPVNNRSEATASWKPQRYLSTTFPESPSLSKHPNSQHVRVSSMQHTYEIPETEHYGSPDYKSHDLEYQIFRECFNKFQKVNYYERQSGSSPLPKGLKVNVYVGRRDITAQPYMQYSYPTVGSWEHHYSNSAKLSSSVIRKCKFQATYISSCLRSMKRELSAVRKTLHLEKSSMLQGIVCIEGLTKALFTNRSRSPTVSSACQTDTLLAVRDYHDLSKEQMDCMFSTRPSEYLNQRLDLFRSQIRSESEQYVSMLEVLELRQKVYLLGVNTQLLEKELAALRREKYQYFRATSQNHWKQLEELYEKNTETLKQTISKYSEEVFERDHTISTLRNELAHNTEEVALLQKKLTDIATSSPTSTDLYVKKYRGLYEQTDKYRMRLMTELERSLSEISKLKDELSRFQVQATELVDENVYLQHKLDYISMKQMKTSQECRTASRRLEAKRMDSEGVVATLRQELSTKNKKIDFLDKRLQSVLGELDSVHASREHRSEVDRKHNCPQSNNKQYLLESIKSSGSNSSIRHIVERNHYLKKPEAYRKIEQHYGRGSYCIPTNKQQLDMLRKSFKNSTRFATEYNDYYGPLSVRVYTLSAMMKHEIQTSFRRYD